MTEKHSFNHTKVLGGPLDVANIQMPTQNYDGFMEMSSAKFQHHIHELFQTATVVTFATNKKDDFRMITQGTTNGSPYEPRTIILTPSDDGIRFTKQNPLSNTSQSTVLISENVEEMEIVSDRVNVGEKEEEEETEPSIPIKPISITKMLEKTKNEKLGPDYIQATYMLKYLNSFTKATQLSKSVIILFHDRGPLILIYKMEQGTIIYCLANISCTEDQAKED